MSATPNVIVTPERFQLILGVNEDHTLELNNVGFDSVMFRLLTISPERYIVRHTKGVIKGNSTAKVTIALNRSFFAEAAAQSGADAPAVYKDDFRMEYCFVGEKDVIEPRSANVPQLIKAKKADRSATVCKKTFRCHVLMRSDAPVPETPARSATSGTGNNSNVNSPLQQQQQQQAASREAASSPGGAGMNPMEADTLREKNRRKEVMGGQSQKQSSGNRNMSKLIMAVAVAVLVLGMYMVIM